MPQHEVIVGNIGTVYSGEDEARAKQFFWHYAELSRTLGGRASGESVTWLVDGGVYDKFAAQREG
jgi:hypothetical protein